MLEIRRFFDPIIIELSELMPTLDIEELADEDLLLDIALHMVAYLLNHLETHRGPSPRSFRIKLNKKNKNNHYNTKKNNSTFFTSRYLMVIKKQ